MPLLFLDVLDGFILGASLESHVTIRTVIPRPWSIVITRHVDPLGLLERDGRGFQCLHSIGLRI